MPKVSLIIPTLNRKTLLTECLRSIFDQAYRDFEVIIVDGGSTDGTNELARLFSIKFLRQEGRFQPSGENLGITCSNGEILAFVDDDVIAGKDWLGHIVQTFDDKRVGGVGGRVIQPDLVTNGRFKPNLTGYTSLRNRIFASLCENRLGETGQILRSGYVTPNLDRVTRTCIEVHTFQGCNMAFRREVFETVGLFDESYMPSPFRFETEFCLRALSRGFRLLYNPEAVVYHQSHKSHYSRPQGSTLGRSLFYNSINSFLFVVRGRRQIPRFSWPRFVLVQLLAGEECLRLALRRRTIAYLLGPWGTIVAFRRWISNYDAARRGHIPTLHAD